ncbi:cyclin-like protein [Pilobolus umbonatus]|nr:cyclin-like protein [Pilobolus umbonatus]
MFVRVMEQWYFTKEELHDTPSIVDGIPFEQEQMDRIKGCHYLLAVGAKLNLYCSPQLVVVTATTFFHRFFMRQSMRRFHVYDIAATSLFVATKVEECTRRIKDIVIACAQKAQKNDKLTLEEDSKDFIKWKETVLHYEVILLETLCFDLSIQHPHTSLFELESQLKISSSCTRRAWMLLYQSLGAPLCVLYKPKVVAVAALLLASYLSTDQSRDWYDGLQDIDSVQVHELAAEMLEYYMDHYLIKNSSSQANSPHPSQNAHHHQHYNGHS